MSDVLMTIPNQVTVKDLKSSIFEKIFNIPVDKQMLWHKAEKDDDFKEEELVNTKTLKEIGITSGSTVGIMTAYLI